jgi:hypothetical protein
VKYKKLNYKYREFQKPYLSEIIFNEWLKNNIQSFNYRPIKKDSNTFYFENIAKCIYLQLDFSSVEAMIVFDNVEDKISIDNHFDLYSIAYIGKEKNDSTKGYYDADRVDNIYTYYLTKKELYINEVFKSIVEYCNRILVPENSVYLGYYGGSTIGFIASSDENNSMVKSHCLRGRLISLNEYIKNIYTKGFYQCIKYDLFDISKAPVIRYFERSPINCGFR